MTHDRQPASASAPVSRYAWYASGVLSLAYMFSQLDRMILSLMVQPIRQDLGLTDTQISLLLGFAFSIATAFAGIPIAWMADRYNRRNIAGIGIVFWSIMTAACGLASNFTQLFIARFGLGVGEAALSPASYSMLADWFPRDKLGKALGINMIGGTLGVGLASIVGGAVVSSLTDVGVVTLPVVGTLHAWQMAFPIAGFPALLVGFWVLTLREPVRASIVAPERADKASVGVLAFLRQNRRAMVAIFVGFPLIILVSQAITSWFPTFLIRQFGWSIGRTGLAFGLILGGFGTAGALASGWLVELLHRRGYTDGCLRAGFVAALVLGVSGVLAPLAPNATLALIFFVPAVVVIVIAVVLAGMSIQIMTPSNMRARVTALYFFVTSMVSGGMGPLAVALITDHVFGRDSSINYSLAIIAGVFCPLAAVAIAYGMSGFRDCMSRIDGLRSANTI